MGGGPRAEDPGRIRGACCAHLLLAAVLLVLAACVELGWDILKHL